MGGDNCNLICLTFTDFEPLQLDVGRVEAQDQEVVQRNNALNKQQAALQAEVRCEAG